MTSAIIMCLCSYGDYPKLPERSQQERDPWYEWDHPDLRRNWGEPVFMLIFLLIRNIYCCIFVSLVTDNLVLVYNTGMQIHIGGHYIVCPGKNTEKFIFQL